jgi:hypothetical protein
MAFAIGFGALAAVALLWPLFTRRPREEVPAP